MTYPIRAAVALLLAVPIVAGGCDVPGYDSAKTTSVESRGETRVVPVSTTTTMPAASAITSTLPAFTGPVSFEEAEAAYRDKRYEEAFGMFSAYAKDRPDNAWGRYMQGLSAWKSGRLDDAAAAFVAALEIDPAHEKSLVNLARVHLDQDRPSDALVQAKQAAELNPSSGDALRLIGRAYGELGDVDAALEAYQRALVVDGQDAWSMNNLGFVLIHAGRFDEALPALARAVEIRDGIAVFNNNLGIALERSGYPGTAAKAFGRALELDSTYERAATNLARVTDHVVGAVEEDVDLEFLARLFAEDIARWRDAPEPVVVEPVEEGSPPITTE
jgi:tetratricopeptide (TPR) repeat protein